MDVSMTKGAYRSFVAGSVYSGPVPASTEDEVPRGDLVAERLADLGDAERDLLPGGPLHVQEVDVDPLGGLGPQVDGRGRILHRPHEGLEHEVEHAGLGGHV